MIVDRTKRLFDRTFPGFTERLQRIDGRYLPSEPHLYVASTRTRPEAIDLTLRYLAKARRGIEIKVNVFAEHRDEWTPVEHCYHIGPDPLSSSDDVETYFRVCRTSKWPYHFHLRGLEHAYDKGHIPAKNANPPLETDPFWFLGLVEAFIETNKIPIGVKP